MQALTVFARRFGASVTQTVSHNVARSTISVRNANSTPTPTDVNSGDSMQNSAKPFESHSKVQDPSTTPTNADKNPKSVSEVPQGQSVKAEANLRQKEAAPKTSGIHETIIQDYSKNKPLNTSQSSNKSDYDKIPEKLKHGNEWAKASEQFKETPAVDGTITNERQKHIPNQAKGPNQDIHSVPGTKNINDNVYDDMKNKAQDVKNNASNKAHEWADNAKDKASNSAQNLKDSASNKAQDLKNSASNSAHNLKESASDKASEWADKAKDKASELKDKASSKISNLNDKATKEKVHDAAEVIKDKAHDAADYTKEKVGEAAESAKEWIQDKSQEVTKSIKDKL